MSYLYYLSLLILTTPIYAENVKSDFRGFITFNNIIGGFSNFIQFMSSVKDIFSILLENDPRVINSTIPIPEDAYLNISELAAKYRYHFEAHNVTTEDGYILTLHRIQDKYRTRNNMVIFLMHGLMDSSDSWVIQGPDKAFAYILAEKGFDVWMGNARGNKHSLAHKKLNPKQSAFWKFTWEEIGIYDLPSMIDYVLHLTEKEKLFYVGHSQGTTSYYVMNSLKPKYNEKIKMMFSLAPVAWMLHAKSPVVRIFAPRYKILAYLLSNFNENSPTTDYFNKIATALCSIIPKRCDNVLYMIIGNDDKFSNESMLPVIFGHMPSGSSTLQFVHYGQLVQSGRFCRYDYGEVKNIKVYGQATPPDYDLSNIKVPLVFYYSANDWLSDPADVNMLKSHVSNVYGDNFILDYNHLDFMYADTAKDRIYSTIIGQINDFERIATKQIENLRNSTMRNTIINV